MDEKHLSKDDLKYLRQEFDSKILDLVNKCGFCPYEYMSGFENIKERQVKENGDKDYEHFLKV